MSNDVPHYRYAQSGEGFSHSYVLPVLLDCLGKCSGPVLDLGCGNGWIARKLLDAGIDVYGVDASASGVEIASHFAPGRFFQLDIQSGKLPAELDSISFNTVISTEVIEHLYDPRSFFDFAKRILKKGDQTGGRIVVSTPYHGYLKNVILALAGKMDSHFTVLWDGGHIKFFSRPTLQAMLVERGFIIERFEGAGRLPYLWKSMVIAARTS